jgi:hypothetical protein
MKKHRLFVSLAALISLCLPLAAQAAPKPSATLTLSGGSVAVGVGFSWGKGMLTYKGKQYKISVKGFDVGDVGITNVTASGQVFNLTKLADFDGNYTSVGAGITVAGGGSTLVMQNQNGVKVQISSTTRGVKLTAAVGGVSMKIKK